MLRRRLDGLPNSIEPKFPSRDGSSTSQHPKLTSTTANCPVSQLTHHRFKTVLPSLLLAASPLRIVSLLRSSLRHRRRCLPTRTAAPLRLPLRLPPVATLRVVLLQVATPLTTMAIPLSINRESSRSAAAVSVVLDPFSTFSVRTFPLSCLHLRLQCSVLSSNALLYLSPIDFSTAIAHRF